MISTEVIVAQIITISQ